MSRSQQYLRRLGNFLSVFNKSIEGSSVVRIVYKCPKARASSSVGSVPIMYLLFPSLIERLWKQDSAFLTTFSIVILPQPMLLRKPFISRRFIGGKIIFNGKKYTLLNLNHAQHPCWTWFCFAVSVCPLKFHSNFRWKILLCVRR